MPLSILSSLQLAASLPISETKLKVLAALTPVAFSTAYVIYLKRSFSSRTTASVTISPPDPLRPRYHAIVSNNSGSPGNSQASPFLADVLANPGEYVVARERVVSLPIPISSLRSEFAVHRDDDKIKRVGHQDAPEALLNAYLQTTMQCFTWTPQSFLMRRIVQNADAKQTFDAGYLKRCQFREGDRVCGVYVVTSRAEVKSNGNRKGEMVVLSLAPPPGWTGPVVRGCLVVGYEKDGEDDVRVMNETILWRNKGDKAVFLEGAVGRWLHTFMVSWFIVRGVEAITG